MKEYAKNYYQTKFLDKNLINHILLPKTAFNHQNFMILCHNSADSSLWHPLLG